MTIQYREETDDVALFSAVTAPEDAMSPAVMRKALELACHGQGTRGNFLGLFGDAIVVSRFMPMEGLTAKSLGVTLLAFADAAAEIGDALSAARQQGAPPKGVEVPEGLPFALLDDLCEFCEVPKEQRPE